MATAREIKRRIASVKNTQKITRAMEMVASVKMRKARQQMLNARPYAEKLFEIAGHLRSSMTAKLSPLLASRTPRKINLVVVTSDKGLCGGFNAYVCRKAVEFIREHGTVEVLLTVIGKKGYQFFSRRQTAILDSYPDVFVKPKYSDAAQAAGKVMNDFISGTSDETWVIYNELVGTASQRTVLRKLLPVEPPQMEHKTTPEYIIEPDESAVVDVVLRKYQLFQMWRIFLESFAAEQASRMTAMHGATKNAGELITKLTLFYNKARQGAITKELLEIVSGAEALQ